MKLMVVGSSRALALLALLVVAGCSTGRQFQGQDGGSDSEVPAGGSGGAGKGSGGAGGHAGAAGTSGATGTGGAVGGHAGGGAGTGGSVAGTGGSVAGTGGSVAGTGGQGTGGTGPTKAENGTTCTIGTDCVSGNCVDSICCSSACTGICQSCKLTATGMPNGMCANVSSGNADPSGTCLAAAANSCGETGTCDGHGGCAFQGSSTICLAAACSGGSFTPASTCDGMGKCVAGTSVACNGFTCTAAAGCATTCAIDTDCTGGYCASTKTCAAKMTNGSTCSANDQCSSNYCVGNICCESSCTGLCQSCSGTDTGQSSGLCKPITAGGGSKGRCTAAGTTCGLDGTCDGNGACRFGASGTTCGSPSCASAALTGAPTCNGAGSCVTPTTTTACSGSLVCASATTCKTSCAADADCVSGYCASGTCTAKVGNGTTCSAGNQCSTGACVGNVCCENACTGLCTSCSSADTGQNSGLCRNIVAGGGLKGRCTAAGTTCGLDGTCDGSGACRFGAGGTTCGMPSCSGSSLTAAPTCNGAGSCVTPTTSTPCPNAQVCASATTCKGGCTADTDCVSGYYCASSVCTAKLVNGSTCSANNQCSNGACVGNICCENACTGLCMSCSSTDTGQTSGLCRNIMAGGGSKGRCTASGTTCGLDGTCNGSGACRYGASGTTCGSTACSSAVLTGAPTCNGTGTCVTPTTTTACPNALVCASATTCKTTCTADSDCLSGYYCASGTCTAVKATGSTCSASDQCSSANCRDSICCPASCTLSCQGCASSVTGSTNGTCALRTSNPAGTQVCNNVCATVNGTDANNCGSCGHSCLGGTCSAGACQPLLLATITGAGSQWLILSGGSLYSVTAATMVAPLVYQLSTSAPSTPVLVAGGLASVASPSCIMDNKVFWTQVNTNPSLLKSCTLGNCAATTTTLTTSAGQAQQNPVCDTSTDEIVWDDYQPQCSGCNETIVTIYRMSANGTNKRTMTSFFELSGSDYYSEAGFISFRPDRFFFSRETYSTMNQVLYYVSTTSAGTSPISIGSGSYGQNGFNPPGNNNIAWANDTMFVWNDSSGFSQISYDLPLPNGLTTAPPVFYPGYLGNGSIVDNQKFYGTFSTLPSDAIASCSVSNCTNPTAMFRGQSGAYGFAEDSTAIYWTTNATAGNGFNVWKGAK